VLHAAEFGHLASHVVMHVVRCAARGDCTLCAARCPSMVHGNRLHRIGLRAAYLSVVAVLGTGDGRTVGAAAASSKARPKPPSACGIWLHGCSDASATLGAGRTGGAQRLRTSRSGAAGMEVKVHIVLVRLPVAAARPVRRSLIASVGLLNARRSGSARQLVIDLEVAREACVGHAA
jgi:hypothetical protein